MLHKSLLVLIGTLAAGGAMAQTPPPAPAAGSGRGGPVGPSVSGPTTPTGKTPPGTPSAASPAGRMARDSVGQKVIGHTATPAGNVPGDTGGRGTGAK